MRSATICSEDLFRKEALSDAKASVVVQNAAAEGFRIVLRRHGMAADLVLGSDDNPTASRIVADLGACARLAAGLSPNQQVLFDLSEPLQRKAAKQ